MLVSELESTIKAQSLRLRDLEERLERVERRRRPRSPSRDERCTVHISRVGAEHTRELLTQMAEKYGRVRSLFIPPRENAGWASVRFEAADEADACVEDGSDIYKRHGLWVALYDERRAKRRQ